MSRPHTDPWFIPWIFQIPFRIRGDILIRKLFPGVWYPAEEKKNFGLGDSSNPKYYNLGYRCFNMQTNLKKGLCKGTDKLSYPSKQISVGYHTLLNKFLVGIQISVWYQSPLTKVLQGIIPLWAKFRELSNLSSKISAGPVSMPMLVSLSTSVFVFLSCPWPYPCRCLCPCPCQCPFPCRCPHPVRVRLPVLVSVCVRVQFPVSVHDPVPASANVPVHVHDHDNETDVHVHGHGHGQGYVWRGHVFIHCSWSW